MKLKTLLLLAVCAALVVAGTACEAGSPNDNVTADEILQNMEVAAAKCISSHVETTQTMSGTLRGSATGNFTSTAISVVMNITGDVDSKNKKMYENMAFIINEEELGNIETDLQRYIVDDYMYTAISTLVDATGKPAWIKAELNETDWVLQRNSLSQIEDMLKNASAVSMAGEETLNGVACWKLSVKPDMAQVLSWAQPQLTIAFVSSPVGGYSQDMFKDVAITAWIDKATYYAIRCDMNMSVDVARGVFGFSMTTNQSKFNYQLNITLPEEADSAKELTVFQ